MTQLFTEDYMVQFLLHNSLGAWWAGRHPDSPLVREFEYLRWVDERTSGQSEQRSEAAIALTAASGSTIHRSDNSRFRLPAAGTFPGWPDRVAEVTMMDPCGGSGHFVVAALRDVRAACAWRRRG